MTTKIQSANKFLLICVDILKLLHERVPEVLIEMISNLENEKLVIYTTKLLKVMFVCPSNKAKIVECGGIAALGKLIRDRFDQNKSSVQGNYQKIIVHALWTLRNLSDEASRKPREATNYQILEVLLHLLKLPDLTIKNLSAGILYDLICKNMENKACTIQQFNGVDVLLERINEILQPNRNITKEQKHQLAEILESCISTLRILTKHSSMENFDSAKQAQNLIRSDIRRFNVIVCLYSYNHEYADKPKI